jgi:hypothetical protein
LTKKENLQSYLQEAKYKMKWRGLTTESKAFCRYEDKNTIDKARWWLSYFFDAAPKYWWHMIRDILRRK